MIGAKEAAEMKDALLNDELGKTYTRIEKLEVTEKQMMNSL